MVYGALPPEMRNHQARLFNEPGNGYDILVASDAVGMGLNLNIRRVVFHTLLKLDRPSTWAPVPAPQIRQIAGKSACLLAGLLGPMACTLNCLHEREHVLSSCCLRLPSCSGCTALKNSAHLFQAADYSWAESCCTVQAVPGGAAQSTAWAP